MEKLENYLIPGYLRKKDGYWHNVIDTINPITKEKIRHSRSTKIKVCGKNKTETKDNEMRAGALLLEFRKKWTKYHFSNSEEKNETEDIIFSDYLLNWVEQQDIGSYTRRNYRFIAKKLLNTLKKKIFYYKI